jgi:cytochrome c-type biogenesis protein
MLGLIAWSDATGANVTLKAWIYTRMFTPYLSPLNASLGFAVAGTAAASLPRLLALRSLGQWVPPISGVVLLITGALTLLANWI